MEQDKIGKCSLITVQCFLIIRLFGDIMQFERIFFQVIKGTVLHTAVDQKLVGIRTEHVADLRIRLAAKLQLGKSKLSVVVSKQRTSLHQRRQPPIWQRHHSSGSQKTNFKHSVPHF